MLLFTRDWDVLLYFKYITVKSNFPVMQNECLPKIYTCVTIETDLEDAVWKDVDEIDQARDRDK